MPDNKTPTVFDFDAIDAARERKAGVAETDAPADAEIATKFRAWCNLRREVMALPFGDDDDAFDTAMVPVDEIEGAMFQIPAGGAAGLAMKLFVWFLYTENDNSDPDPCTLAARLTTSGGNQTGHKLMLAAMIRDIAALAPELSASCFGSVAAETLPPKPHDDPQFAAYVRYANNLIPIEDAATNRLVYAAIRHQLSEKPPQPTILAAEAILAAGEEALTRAVCIAPSTLTELIAEDSAIWEAQTKVQAEAEKLCWAWRDAGGIPSVKARDCPGLGGQLYRLSEAMVEAGGALTDRIHAWLPASFDDACTLLGWAVDSPECQDITQHVHYFLQAMPHPSAIEDAPAVLLFRDWLAAEGRANELGMNAPDGDPEFNHACEQANDILDRIYATPATDLPSLAIKAWLRLYEDHPSGNGVVNLKDLSGFDALSSELALARDLSRILPDLLAPRIALCSASSYRREIST